MKNLNFETKEAILNGIERLAQAVGATLGAGGRNALFQLDKDNYAITKDGVTVANQIQVEDESENAVIQIVKDAAARTARDAGDGTTTSTVLVYEIVKEIMKTRDDKVLNVTEVRRGIEDAAKELIEEIERLKEDVGDDETLENIAKISGNNDEEIGKMMLDVYSKVGKEGAIRIEETQNDKTTVDLINGCQIESGYSARNFVTNYSKNTMEYEDVLLFVTDNKFENSIHEIVRPIEIAQEAQKPLVIICGGMEGEPLFTLIANKVQRKVPIGVIEAPYFGDERMDVLEDVAAMTGAMLVSDARGDNVDEMTIEDMGFADKIISGESTTTIIGRHGDQGNIDERVEYIKNQKEEDKNGDMAWRLNQRLASLTSGVGVIYAGGKSESEMKDVYYRLEDALAATKSALNNGYVIGGGMAYYNAAIAVKEKHGKENPSYIEGWNAMINAAKKPVEWIVKNATGNGVLVDIGGNIGFDAISCKSADLFELGIIDPFQVVKSCINNASSVSSMLITTNVIITNKIRKK